MKRSHQLLLSWFLALLIVYFGGWRIVVFSVEPSVKILEAKALLEDATAYEGGFIMNGPLNVYIYETAEGSFVGVINEKSKRYGDASMILALLAIAIPFGIFII